METVAVLLVRQAKEAGLVINTGAGLKPGLYEINDVLGEYVLKYRGESSIDSNVLCALSPDSLFGRREAIFKPKTK